MSVPLSDTRLTEIRERMTEARKTEWSKCLGDGLLLLAEVDRLRAELVSTRYELSDVKLRRDDARAGRQDAENEVDRLRARLAEIAELHAPMGGDCGYCADETGGAHRWPCPTAKLATAPADALGAGQ